MLNQILNNLQSTDTQLIAVSKTHPPEKILEIYQQGQKVFGENKALGIYKAIKSNTLLLLFNLFMVLIALNY